MTHVRYTLGLKPGGDKQASGHFANVTVVDGETEIDISANVMEAQINERPGKATTLTLTIAGFELA